MITNDITDGEEKEKWNIDVGCILVSVDFESVLYRLPTDFTATLSLSFFVVLTKYSWQ